MDLRLREETFQAAENREWLGGQHGTNECESITLDGDTFLATFTDGIVPSGVVLGRITATGLYGPYNNAAVDGREVARGHLFSTIDLNGTTAATAVDSPAALFWHGRIVESKLPTGHGLDAAGKADLNLIRYV